MTRILLILAISYLVYSIIRRYFRFVSGGSKKQEQFNRADKTQQPEGHITVEKLKDKKKLDDDDFVDFEEIK